MKLSARNVLKGRVVKVMRGQTTAHVKIDVGGGSVVTASITVEAVDELRVARGRRRLRGDQGVRRHRGQGLRPRTC